MLPMRSPVHNGMVDGERLFRHYRASCQRHQNRNLESDEVSHVCLYRTRRTFVPLRCRYSMPCCQVDQPDTAHRHYFGYAVQVTRHRLPLGYFHCRGLIPKDPVAVYGPLQQIFREGLSEPPATTWQEFDDAPAVVVVEDDKKEHQKAQSRLPLSRNLCHPDDVLSSGVPSLPRPAS